MYCIASPINNTVLHWILPCPTSYASSPLIYSPSLSPSLSLHPSSHPLPFAHMQWLEESLDYKSAPQPTVYLLKTFSTSHFSNRTPEHVWKCIWLLPEQAFIWARLTGCRSNISVLLFIKGNIWSFPFRREAVWDAVCYTSYTFFMHTYIHNTYIHKYIIFM